MNNLWKQVISRVAQPVDVLFLAVVKDTNREETDLTDDDQDQFEEAIQKEPEVIRLKSYTNRKLTRAKSMVQSGIFLIENIESLEKYLDTDAWIAVKSLLKLYKDKFVGKLCLEPAEKIAYNVKYVSIFFILNAKIFQLITKNI